MNAQPNFPAETTLATARRGEASLTVLQDNEQRCLTIHQINAIFAQRLGYEPAEISQHNLKSILGKETAESLQEDLEYADNAPDFGDIISRIRQLRFRHKNGEEITITCTVSRMMAQGRNACFQLVAPDEQEQRSTNSMRNFIALNLEGRQELDALTGLPNRSTALNFLPLLRNYLAASDMSVVFAVIRLDRHEKSLKLYGAEACAKLLLHAYHCCRSTFRAEDIIFALSDHTLGVVLFNISRESSRVVLNRLRWQIRNHRIVFGGKSDFSVTTCIGFDMLNVDGADAVFEQCEHAMHALDANERNALVELGAA